MAKRVARRVQRRRPDQMNEESAPHRLSGHDGVREATASPAELIHRAAAAPQTVAHQDVVALQRALGNQVTGSVIAHGRPLPDGLRERFERSLGADLSAVRLHTGRRSAEASRALKARAFTLGQDIHFAPGQLDPAHPEGQHLLAHEVAHTVQQRGGAPDARTKLEVSHPGDAQEREADRAADRMVRGRPVAVGTGTGAGKIARTPDASTPFKGAAGKAELAAIETSGEALGVGTLSVKPDHVNQQMARKDKQLEEFRTANIPFVDDNQDHYLYKLLINLRQEYEQDFTRIALAQGAFNEFVVPGTLASKSMAQFKSLQFELGYFDEVSPTEDLSGREQASLGKLVDQKRLNELNLEISSRSTIVQGLQKQILGTSHAIQAALQRRAAILAAEAKQAAEDDKAKIEQKIKAVTDAVEMVGTVVDTASFAVGAPGTVAKIAGGGAEGVETGLDLGSKGVGMVGSVVEFIMTEMYKDELQKAKAAIMKASAAESFAKKMDADLSYTGSMLDLSGLIQELSGQMGLLALSLQARKAYFAKLGEAGDKATHTKPGGKMSQYVAYVAQAYETKTHLETARASAAASYQVMAEQAVAMRKHRMEWYGVAGSVWAADSKNMQDGIGPDLQQINDARFMLEKFGKSAEKQMQIIDEVVASLPKGT